MKHIRPSQLLAAVALAAAAIPAMAQLTPGTPRGTYDPYSQGARSTEKFDPYTQGANAPTRQDLAPAPEAQPSTVPAQPGMPGTTMQRTADPSMDSTRWGSPDLGRPLGRRNQFLDGS
ncbi:endonuclease [Cupriavidus necator]